MRFPTSRRNHARRERRLHERVAASLPVAFGPIFSNRPRVGAHDVLRIGAPLTAQDAARTGLILRYRHLTLYRAGGLTVRVACIGVLVVAHVLCAWRPAGKRKSPPGPRQKKCGSALLDSRPMDFRAVTNRRRNPFAFVAGTTREEQAPRRAGGIESVIRLPGCFTPLSWPRPFFRRFLPISRPLASPGPISARSV